MSEPDVVELTEKVSDLETQIDGLKDEISDLKDERKELKDEVEELEDEKDDLEKDVRKLEVEIGRFYESANAAEDMQKALELYADPANWDADRRFVPVMRHIDADDPYWPARQALNAAGI